jgi:hypothetical protein
MVLGCNTPPSQPEVVYRYREPEPTPREEPLTPANLERLQEMPDFTRINNYQFVLVNQIRLTLVKNTRTDHNNLPPKGAIFENVSIRNQITFQDKILGQAVGDVTVVGEKYVLRVCFEHPTDDSKYPAATHYLHFSARRSEQTGYFYLEYDDPRPDSLSNEKGTLTYGPETYTLTYDERPYLLMRLERRADKDESIRTVGGRKVD